MMYLGTVKAQPRYNRGTNQQVNPRNPTKFVRKPRYNRGPRRKRRPKSLQPSRTCSDGTQLRQSKWSDARRAGSSIPTLETTIRKIPTPPTWACFKWVQASAPNTGTARTRSAKLERRSLTSALRDSTGRRGRASLSWALEEGPAAKAWEFRMGQGLAEE
jgi:hypothetical protein